ncbi:saccharopine dehydrogenase NADP-binding domain-containing protein [Methylobacterium oryzae CBMB20]
MTAILIYGATGYTGQLLAAHAVGQGLRPILAGRDPEKLRPPAARLGLEMRAARLDDAAGLRTALSGVAAVIHAAGPFSRTARPMAEACLAAGAHYVDITGEIAVLEALAARDTAARAAGIVLLPAAGSRRGAERLPRRPRGRAPARRDASAHLHRRVRRLQPRHRADHGGGHCLGHAGTPGRTHRRVAEPAPRHRRFRRRPAPDRGPRLGRRLERVVLDAGPEHRRLLRGLPRHGGGGRSARRHQADHRGGTAQRLINRGIDRLPAGPSAAAREKARSTFLAEAWDGTGRRAASRMETAEGYTLTVWTALEAARRVAAGAVAPGFHTPVTAFGPDFILGFPHVVRTDL